MRFVFLLLSVFAISLQVCAQQKTAASSIVQLSSDPLNPRNRLASQLYLPLKDTYIFPAFKEGTVYFRNGDTVFIQKMNYNILLNQMHVINPDGDTVQLNEPVSVSKVVIMQTSFYYFKGNYLQEITNTKKVILGYRREFRAEMRIAESADSLILSNSKNIIKEGCCLEDGQVFKLENGRIVFIHATPYFYFGDEYGNFIKADKPALLNLMEKNRPLVEQFITSHHTAFNNLSDLLDVLQFSETLQ
ncbi:MAG: hypothetical protein QM726_23620 [Chitinophagaceae bacterium]